jgi:hypothetical protein
VRYLRFQHWHTASGIKLGLGIKLGKTRLTTNCDLCVWRLADA